MGMVVSLFLALAAMVTVYGWLGQGGGVAGLVFFGILLIGATIRVFGPQSDSRPKRARVPALGAGGDDLQVLGLDAPAPDRRPCWPPRG